MKNNNWDKYIDKMHKEILPALGCTEPVAVALAVAKAKSAFENEFVIKNVKAEELDIEVLVSRNILKNAMSVGIPGTNFCGLEYASALGFFGGNAAAGLEVFQNVSSEDIVKAEKYIKEKGVKVSLKPVQDSIYIEAILKIAGQVTKAVIRETHSNVVLIERNGQVIFEKMFSEEICTEEAGDVFQNTSLIDIYKFATEVPLEKLDFLKDVIRLNSAIYEEGLKNDYGLGLGKRMNERIKNGAIGSDLCNTAIMRCACAIDARMAGCTLPAMSNSGSGNQGITATMPVWSVAKDTGVSEEKLIRAVALSHIVTIFIKKGLDRLSALCGAIVAGTGSTCGIVYLLGGSYKEAEMAVKNMIANLSGMICDGAKSSCSLKVASSVQAAFQSVYLAMDGVCVKDIEGIIEQDVDRTIQNLGILGSEGMKETDKVILKVMTSK